MLRCRNDLGRSIPQGCDYPPAGGFANRPYRRSLRKLLPCRVFLEGLSERIHLL